MDTLQCDICGAECPSVHDAMRDGWSPSYYEPDATHETTEPVCGRCWDCGFLSVADDGFLELTTRGIKARQIHHQTGQRLKLEKYRCRHAT